MTLSNGRRYLAIPGPTVVPDRVLAAMHRGSPDIYAGELIAMAEGVLADLRRAAATRAAVAIYVGNGHGAWEAAIANMFSRGDRALVAVTGAFGAGWANAAEGMGVAVERIDFGLRRPADPAAIAAALGADTDRKIRAVLVTHVDTATAVRNDLAAVRAAIDVAGHPALLAVDAVASLGCEALRMDDWGIDVLVAASQKGLMCPPGIGLLWLSDRARTAARDADLRTPYWEFESRADPAEFWHRFGGTPPTHHLYGLREALTMLLHEEGLEAAWARHAVLARAVWAAFDAWGRGGDIALNIAAPGDRSHAVTAARIGGGGAARLRAWCEAVAGVTLGVGIGMVEPDDPARDDFLRVAHMGHVNAHMTLGTLAVMEAGMRALDIPHGPGALDAAAEVVAGAG
ncbi:pyridoxal-phosphate-dependent aminotransferase family protein [Defluviimonas salinarum]|uniref:Aminotransferase class V-fold PLP-dependent enzyme n=1 Tax=Defluviimonas salinarum TaxID=2992147 RepID=A0ABT3J516_9RHOB|nr:aminotransferase class V-fold PLP-dependent enzyme [Defluviimonas salinarum]MCW3782779.1 aminotransferase class V-fold PLP-dependent enzyme [Defluviimonas salinarum]